MDLQYAEGKYKQRKIYQAIILRYNFIERKMDKAYRVRFGVDHVWNVALSLSRWDEKLKLVEMPANFASERDISKFKYVPPAFEPEVSEKAKKLAAYRQKHSKKKELGGT